MLSPDDNNVVNEFRVGFQGAAWNDEAYEHLAHQLDPRKLHKLRLNRPRGQLDTA